MFGGVDLFGGGKKTEKTRVEPAEATPTALPKVATKPDKREILGSKEGGGAGGGLFEDGDDIFNFQPAARR